MINLELFDKILPTDIFASGIIENSSDGIYMTNYDLGRLLSWQAVKGFGNDWTIYITWKDENYKLMSGNADKVTSKENILKLVPCDEEVYKKYRF